MLFLAPFGSLRVDDPHDFIGLALFTSVNVFISALTHALHRARQRAEITRDAARESEERLRRIVAAATDAIITVDTDQKITLFNTGAETIFGYSREEMVGRKLDQLIPERFCEAHRRHIEVFGATGVSVRAMGEERVLAGLRRNGEEFPVEARISQIDVAGKTFYTVILRDITARKRAEAEREAAIRAKDEFLAMLGHELRTPLSAVKHAVVAAQLDDGRRKQALEIAGRQADQLGWLLDDLLDVARIAQGRITLRKERIHLGAIIRRAVEATRPVVEERRHELSVSLPLADVRVAADPARIEQIVVNLITNAAKYTEPGGRITLTMERQGDEAVISIRDSGIGIAPDLLPRVFDLFTQADRALDRAQGGLGVGLTVARRLVELHGGQIEARSEGLGRGAEFVVRLPALPAAPEDAAPAPRVEADHQGRARVLLVEDHPDAGESLRMLLEVLGHHVRVVREGNAALDMARANVPDVMLIDIGLPGMDGYEVARRMRQQPELKRVVLVALTGYATVDDRQAAFAAGFDYHLVKPVNPDALQDLVTRFGNDGSEKPRAVH
jgi:PAS domain S-box-containing protein